MESQLIKQIRLGNSKAVVRFYKLYSPKIIVYLAKKLPRHEDAQEITNDVFLEAIDSIALLREEKIVLAWLYRIARNKTADYYRKRKIKSILLSQLPYLEIVANEISQPEFQLEKERIKDKIESAFRQLSEKHQKILCLHYECSMPVKEIATKLCLSFKATESLLFRARQNFKLLYERT